MRAALHVNAAARSFAVDVFRDMYELRRSFAPTRQGHVKVKDKTLKKMYLSPRRKKRQVFA
jgi:hypothetical protein